MDPRRSPDRQITSPKQLLVEGATPHIFFEAFAKHLAVQNLQIFDFKSNSELAPFLRAFCARPEFKQLATSLAIIRDAEHAARPGDAQTIRETAMQAFQSVCTSLQAAGQAVPNTPGAFTASTPRIGVFILPDCANEGMLETLCLNSVLTPEIERCIEQFFACMETNGLTRPRNMTKAKTFAFLASQNIADPLVGRAAQKGIWPWEHDAFAKLKDFLKSM